MLTATQEAKTQVDKILVQYPGKVFRVSVNGGGCSGFRFDFELSEREDDDIIVSENGDHVIVTDTISSMYLDNAVLDFKDDVFSQSFTLETPDVKTTCGCGQSVGF